MDKWLIKKSVEGTDQSNEAFDSSTSVLKVDTNSGDSKKQVELGKSRKFQEKWQQLYPWLLYDPVKEKAFCSICKTAHENKINLPVFSVTDQNSKNAFVIDGFSAWNKALQRFKSHEGKIIILLFYSVVDKNILTKILSNVQNIKI